MKKAILVKEITFFKKKEVRISNIGVFITNKKANETIKKIKEVNKNSTKSWKYQYIKSEIYIYE